MAETVGIVCETQRYAVHDGPGIRTVVFLKGCPLRCAWCQNPEAIGVHPEISFLRSRCLECATCVVACSRDAITLPGDRRIDRNRCDACGDCVEVCVAEALTLVGRRYTVEALLAEVLRDRDFYAASGGGVTLSGGEPFRQREFVAAFLRAAKDAGLHITVETCGYFPWHVIEPLFDDIDLVYFDLKAMDPQVHRATTGVGNTVILANAQLLVERGNEVVFRCPLVPGITATDDNIGAVIAFLRRHHQRLVHLLPYHTLGESKLERIDSNLRPLGLLPLNPAVTAAIAARLDAAGIRAVIGGS
jgi:pyruvate formate lyase activating enzyme